MLANNGDVGRVPDATASDVAPSSHEMEPRPKRQRIELDDLHEQEQDDPGAVDSHYDNEIMDENEGSEQDEDENHLEDAPDARQHNDPGRVIFAEWAPGMSCDESWSSSTLLTRFWSLCDHAHGFPCQLGVSVSTGDVAGAATASTTSSAGEQKSSGSEVFATTSGRQFECLFQLAPPDAGSSYVLAEQDGSMNSKSKAPTSAREHEIENEKRPRTISCAARFLDVKNGGVILRQDESIPAVARRVAALPLCAGPVLVVVDQAKLDTWKRALRQAVAPPFPGGETREPFGDHRHGATSTTSTAATGVVSSSSASSSSSAAADDYTNTFTTAALNLPAPQRQLAPFLVHQHQRAVTVFATTSELWRASGGFRPNAIVLVPEATIESPLYAGQLQYGHWEDEGGNLRAWQLALFDVSVSWRRGNLSKEAHRGKERLWAGLQNIHSAERWVRVDPAGIRGTTALGLGEVGKIALLFGIDLLGPAWRARRAGSAGYQENEFWSGTTSTMADKSRATPSPSSCAGAFLADSDHAAVRDNAGRFLREFLFLRHQPSTTLGETLFLENENRSAPTTRVILFDASAGERALLAKNGSCRGSDEEEVSISLRRAAELTLFSAEDPSSRPLHNLHGTTTNSREFLVRDRAREKSKRLFRAVCGTFKVLRCYLRLGCLLEMIARNSEDEVGWKKKRKLYQTTAGEGGAGFLPGGGGASGTARTAAVDFAELLRRAFMGELDVEEENQQPPRRADQVDLQGRPMLEDNAEAQDVEQARARQNHDEIEVDQGVEDDGGLAPMQVDNLPAQPPVHGAAAAGGGVLPAALPGNNIVNAPPPPPRSRRMFSVSDSVKKLFQDLDVVVPDDQAAAAKHVTDSIRSHERTAADVALLLQHPRIALFDCGLDSQRISAKRVGEELLWFLHAQCSRLQQNLKAEQAAILRENRGEITQLFPWSVIEQRICKIAFLRQEAAARAAEAQQLRIRRKEEAAASRAARAASVVAAENNRRRGVDRDGRHRNESGGEAILGRSGGGHHNSRDHYQNGPPVTASGRGQRGDRDQRRNNNAPHHHVQPRGGGGNRDYSPQRGAGGGSRNGTNHDRRGTANRGGPMIRGQNFSQAQRGSGTSANRNFSHTAVANNNGRSAPAGAASRGTRNWRRKQSKMLNNSTVVRKDHMDKKSKVQVVLPPAASNRRDEELREAQRQRAKASNGNMLTAPTTSNHNPLHVHRNQKKNLPEPILRQFLRNPADRETRKSFELHTAFLQRFFQDLSRYTQNFSKPYLNANALQGVFTASLPPPPLGLGGGAASGTTSGGGQNFPTKNPFEHSRSSASKSPPGGGGHQPNHQPQAVPGQHHQNQNHHHGSNRHGYQPYSGAGGGAAAAAAARSSSSRGIIRHYNSCINGIATSPRSYVQSAKVNLAEELSKKIEEHASKLSTEVKKFNFLLRVADEASPECPICFEDPLDPADAVVTNCGHVFCKDCMDTLLSSSLLPTCAICRQTVQRREIFCLKDETDYVRQRMTLKAGAKANGNDPTTESSQLVCVEVEQENKEGASATDENKTTPCEEQVDRSTEEKKDVEIIDLTSDKEDEHEQALALDLVACGETPEMKAATSSKSTRARAPPAPAPGAATTTALKTSLTAAEKKALVDARFVPDPKLDLYIHETLVSGGTEFAAPKKRSGGEQQSRSPHQGLQPIDTVGVMSCAVPAGTRLLTLARTLLQISLHFPMAAVAVCLEGDHVEILGRGDENRHTGAGGAQKSHQTMKKTTRRGQLEHGSSGPSKTSCRRSSLVAEAAATLDKCGLRVLALEDRITASSKPLLDRKIANFFEGFLPSSSSSRCSVLLFSPETAGLLADARDVFCGEGAASGHDHRKSSHTSPKRTSCSAPLHLVFAHTLRSGTTESNIAAVLRPERVWRLALKESVEESECWRRVAVAQQG